MHALVSIHDVMPHTLDKVTMILQRLPETCRNRTLLLVVPGLNWSSGQVAQLKHWQEEGYILAGHGWLHRSRNISGLYHQLHSLLVSRKAAEHLALKEQEIADLLFDCHHWFTQNGLKAPNLYVPPAWAMGRISKALLKTTPFRFFENSMGLYDSETDQNITLPLVGFEADTLFRKYALLLWNKLNKKLSSINRPLRISLHPNDYSLHLSDAIDSYLAEVESVVNYYKVVTVT
ncbi:polysaccharide deacetylase family protein [Gammaproteobacteria bacterium]|nr:polysaccharide deacetylase family protein [Gammaproteobacteria bacterium]